MAFKLLPDCKTTPFRELKERPELSSRTGTEGGRERERENRLPQIVDDRVTSNYSTLTWHICRKVALIALPYGLHAHAHW